MATKVIKGAMYQHYKGDKYEVIGIAKHSESMEQFVVYHKLYNESALWIRPLRMFTDEVTVSGKKVARFQALS